MIFRLAIIALFLTVPAGALLAGEAQPPAESAASARAFDARKLLVFHGNVVLPDEVYLAIIKLPEAGAVSDETARSVRAQCRAFLVSSGYELAEVETAVEGDHIRVDIDEGHLEKIIFRGTSSVRTMQALFVLGLPHDVFNRPYIERQIARAKIEYGIDIADWKLVKSKEPRKIIPEMGSFEPSAKLLSYPGGTTANSIIRFGTFIGRSLIPPRAEYELHIFFQRRAWSPGLGLDASLGGPDGLRIGLKYKNEGLLFASDRWAVEGAVGSTIRNRLRDQHSYVALQRAAAGASWFTPPFLGELRPALVVRGDLTSRQRDDLGLENYMATRSLAGLALNYDLFIGGKVFLGFGAERFDVFHLEREDPSTAPLVSPGNDTQPCLDTALQLTFNPDEIRADRKHEFAVNGRYRLGNDAYSVSTYRYQFIIPIGWHDIWLESHGAYLWGQVPFFEEQSVGGTHIRGIYSSRLFTRRVVSGGVEFRYSLIRDVYKAGIFVDSALFGEFSSDRRHDHARVVTGFGPSFHILIASAFQLDIFLAFNATSHVSDERGFSVTLNQAF